MTAVAVAVESDVGIVSSVNIEKNHVGVTTVEDVCLDLFIIRKHAGYCNIYLASAAHTCVRMHMWGAVYGRDAV
jgi:hypothetical protein